MQRLIENYPEFRVGERNVTKHFNLLDAIRSKIGDENLYTISELEQDICSTQSDDKIGVFSRIKVLVEDPKTKVDSKLKLILLFCLKYEGDVLC